MYAFHRRDVHYYFPRESNEIIEHIFTEFPELKSLIQQTDVRKWRNKEVDIFYPYYQTQVRKFIKGEVMEYLERRWAAYWTHCNTITSIITSLLAIIIYNLTSPLSFDFDPSYRKVISTIFFISYFFVTWYQCGRARKDGCRFEYIILSKRIRKKVKNTECE
jgi:hypothetical protein